MDPLQAGDPVTAGGGEPRPGQFSVNRMTGDWITRAPLRHSESCVIAASVMPGWTPELVATLYAAWLSADGQSVTAVFAGGRVTVVDGGGTVWDMTQTPEQPTVPVEVPAKETVDVPVDPAVVPEVDPAP